MTARRRRLWLVLAAALLASLFANGRVTLWPAAWISGLLLVRYFRQATGWRPWVLGGLGLFVTSTISWFGLIPFPPAVFLNVQMQGAVIGLVPFALDRLTHSHTARVWWQSLVLPMAATAVALYTYASGGTTWGAVGYTQIGFLPLVQLASVTGVWGVGFLVFWFASWGNNLWEDVEAGDRPRRANLVYPAILATVIVVGATRMLVTPSSSTEPATAAAVSPPDLLDILTAEELGLVQQHYMKQALPDDQLNSIAATFDRSNEELYGKTRREARSGASIIFWPEASVIALGRERLEAALGTLATLADDENIYLGATLAYVPDDAAQPNQNSVIAFGPDGRTLGTYDKTRLIPVVEEPFTRPGSGAITSVDTAIGTFGLAICYDLDDPAFVAGLAATDIGILVAPSGDWSAIKYIHSAMARFRAIEMGVSLFRPANHGLSQMIDTRGRVLASMDHDEASDRVLRAEWRPERVTTLYAWWGDAFAWACALALLPVTALAWRRRTRRQRMPDVSEGRSETLPSAASQLREQAAE